MPRGSKPGERRGGRQPGTPNKKTALVNAAFNAATSNPDLSPLDFLLGVMRDASVSPELRIKAAQAAAPYVHAKPGRSQATDPAESAKPIEVVRKEAEDRGRLLELVLADFSGELSGAEAEELKSLEKAYPPDPNDPLKHVMEAYDRALADQRDKAEKFKAAQKRQDGGRFNELT
jgi:hypothetical protein